MKKGFTLAELLGVTVLLALIMAVSYPVLFGIFNEKKDELDANKRAIIETAAINYAKSNINEYPYKEKSNVCMFLSDLVDKGLISYEVEDNMLNRIVKVNMGVNNKYTAEVLDSGVTCSSNGIVYEVTTCTDDNSSYQYSTLKYSIKDDRTIYKVGDEIVKQTDHIYGEKASDLASFKIQTNNYETLNNLLRYHDGVSSVINKSEEYFDMKVKFDMNEFTSFPSEESSPLLAALANAPIFYNSETKTLKNTCS